mgnify:CR=1 FL=1
MYVLIMVLVGVLLNHLSITQKDNGILLVVDGRELDVIGMAQEKWVKLTRDCQRVQRVEHLVGGRVDRGGEGGERARDDDGRARPPAAAAAAVVAAQTAAAVRAPTTSSGNARRASPASAPRWRIACALVDSTASKGP